MWPCEVDTPRRNRSRTLEKRNRDPWTRSKSTRPQRPQWRRRKVKESNSRDGAKVFARPKVRAYFQGNRLFKSRGDNEYAATASISLFTDLLFVGVLAETGNLAVLGSNAINLLWFIVQFLSSWRIWCCIRDIVAMYEMNAASQRFLVLYILCLLIGFTCKYIPRPSHRPLYWESESDDNILDSDDSTTYMAVGFYVAARLSIGILNVFGAMIYPKFRTFHLWNALVAIIPTGF